jgi:tetratricopeptide (TPR) repeat protein
MLVILAGYVGVRLYTSAEHKHDESALGYFEMAREDYQASITATEEEKKKTKLEGALNSLDVLEGEYRDTKAAVMGEILRADILMSQGNYGRAREIYEELAAKEKTGDFHILARLGVAQCLAADENGLPSAIEEYQDLRKEFPTSPLMGQIEFELAVALDTADRDTEALQIYKTFGEDSPWYSIAQERIESLEAPVYLRSKTGA